jgi:hypothetical protein
MEVPFYCHPACSVFTILSGYPVFNLHAITNMLLLNLKVSYECILWLNYICVLFRYSVDCTRYVTKILRYRELADRCGLLGILLSFYYLVFLDPGPHGEADGAQGPGYSRSMEAGYRLTTQTETQSTLAAGHLALQPLLF